MKLHFLSVLLLSCHGYLSSTNLVLSGLAAAIESPQFTIVHSESDFEIRLYRESTWITAPVKGSSFQNSTKSGFHRLYQYVHGANLNASQFALTAPVLTSITKEGSLVRIYVSSQYQGAPPLPNPELSLQIDKWRSSRCVAVRKFSGFAKDDNIDKEVEALVTSLNKKHLTGNTTVLEDKISYTIAQYNASYHLTGRVNEVWINVSGFVAEGCLPY